MPQHKLKKTKCEGYESRKKLKDVLWLNPKARILISKIDNQQRSYYIII